MTMPITHGGLAFMLDIAVRLPRGGTSRTHRCVQHPGLERTTLRTTRTAKPRVTWSLDGRRLASFDEARQRLGLTPERTADAR